MTSRRTFVSLALCGLLTAGAAGDATDTATTRPHRRREGVNLVGDASVAMGTAWTLLGGAAFDRAVSHKVDGSGAIRLTKPIPDGSMAFSDYVPVREAAHYTFALYMRTINGPTYAGAQVALYDRDRRFLRNLTTGRLGTTRDGAWEEAALSFTVPKGTAYVRLQAYKTENTRPGGQVWVDDFYLGEGLGLEQPPALKHGFRGGEVRVDALGNFEIRKGTRWIPFFPLCIYSDNARDPSVYSRQGWNTVIWTGDAEQVRKAREAVSVLNPEGMMAGFSLAQYTFPNGWAYNDLKDLATKLREIRERKLADNLLLYYWDNEMNHGQWDVPAAVIRTVRTVDADAVGRPQRPVYALQGEFNIARVHAARGLTDVSGTYVGGAASVAGMDGTDGLFFLDRLEGQSTPAAFAQFSGVKGPGDMRLRLYSAVLLGARAMGYWRDCFDPQSRRDNPDVGPVDEKPWWPDFPNLRREVDRLLPLIRAPHWTSWTARVDPAKSVLVGTRDYAGEGYVFLVNRTTRLQAVTVHLEGLPYRPVEARDYFDGRSRAPIRAGVISLQLPAVGIASGTAVLRLAGGRSSAHSVRSLRPKADTALLDSLAGAGEREHLRPHRLPDDLHGPPTLRQRAVAGAARAHPGVTHIFVQEARFVKSNMPYRPVQFE